MRAPPRVVGESIDNYRRRLLEPLVRFSLRWKDLKVDTVGETALGTVAEQIFADSIATIKRSGPGAGPLREVVENTMPLVARASNSSVTVSIPGSRSRSRRATSSAGTASERKVTPRFRSRGRTHRGAGERFAATARLRAALAAQVKAKQDHDAAAAAVERVRQLMRDADIAEDAAEAAAIAATQAWAASGAKNNESSGNRALLDNAAAGQRRAAEARLIAEGARNAMPGIESAATVARIAAENAAEEIKAAVLVAELEPHLEVLEHAHRDYVASLEEAMALRMVLKAGGPANAYFPYRSLAGAEAVSQRLRACEIDDRHRTSTACRCVGRVRAPLGERLGCGSMNLPGPAVSLRRARVSR